MSHYFSLSSSSSKVTSVFIFSASIFICSVSVSATLSSLLFWSAFTTLFSASIFICSVSVSATLSSLLFWSAFTTLFSATSLSLNSGIKT